MVDPLSYFSFQPVLYDWYNKGNGMCYPVCGMMLKYPCNTILLSVRPSVSLDKIEACINVLLGARCKFVVEHLFMVRWVVGSIAHGGPIELFHVPRLV